MSGNHSTTGTDPTYDTYDPRRPRGGGGAGKQAPINPLVLGLGAIAAALLLALVASMALAASQRAQVADAVDDRNAVVSQANQVIEEATSQRDAAQQQLDSCTVLIFVNDELQASADAAADAFEARRNGNYPWMFKQTRKAQEKRQAAVEVRVDAGFETHTDLIEACTGQQVNQS
jgi:hypothetical protein